MRPFSPTIAARKRVEHVEREFLVKLTEPSSRSDPAQEACHDLHHEHSCTICLHLAVHFAGHGHCPLPRDCAVLRACHGHSHDLRGPRSRGLHHGVKLRKQVKLSKPECRLNGVNQLDINPLCSCPFDPSKLQIPGVRPQAAPSVSVPATSWRSQFSSGASFSSRMILRVDRESAVLHVDSGTKLGLGKPAQF